MVVRDTPVSLAASAALNSLDMPTTLGDHVLGHPVDTPGQGLRLLPRAVIAPASHPAAFVAIGDGIDGPLIEVGA